MAKAPKGIEVTARVSREAARVLTPAALNFLAGLQRMFDARPVSEPAILEQPAACLLYTSDAADE